VRVLRPLFGTPPGAVLRFFFERIAECLACGARICREVVDYIGEEDAVKVLLYACLIRYSCGLVDCFFPNVGVDQSGFFQGNDDTANREACQSYTSATPSDTTSGITGTSKCGGVAGSPGDFVFTQDVQLLSLHFCIAFFGLIFDEYVGSGSAARSAAGSESASTSPPPRRQTWQGGKCMLLLEMLLQVVYIACGERCGEEWAKTLFIFFDLHYYSVRIMIFLPENERCFGPLR